MTAMEEEEVVSSSSLGTGLKDTQTQNADQVLFKLRILLENTFEQLELTKNRLSSTHCKLLFICNIWSSASVWQTQSL